MLETLDERKGDHAFVTKYKGKVNDDIICRIIEIWACSLEPAVVLAEKFWTRHLKNLEFSRKYA